MKNHRYITISRIFHTGIVNFIRNMSLAIAAMAVMVVTLTIVLFSLISNATFTNTVQQITNKINVSVYLKDTTTDAQAKSMVADIDKLPSVEKTDYLNKKQALQAYISQNKSNTNLIAAATQAGNPQHHCSMTMAALWICGASTPAAPTAKTLMRCVLMHND